MAKPKFKWMINTTDSTVEVYLNGDISRIIEIEYSTFYENIADILTEINVFQFLHGVKTEITPTSFNHLRKAYSLHENWRTKTVPDYDHLALLYAEKYGIIEYNVEGNKMTYLEKLPTEGTFIHTVNLDTNKEDVKKQEEK